MVGAPAVVEGDRFDYEARSAIAALERIVRDECALHGMKPGTESLHRRDAAAIERGCRQQAACHADAVHLHGARAAYALATGKLGSGQPESVTQYLDGGLL